MSFQPTFGVFETARNVKTFCADNESHFRKLLLSVLPFLFIAGLIQSAVQSAPHKTTEMWILFELMFLLKIYVYTMLAVTWHRFTIQGPDSDQDINIFKKNAGVWLYIGFLILLIVIHVIVGLPFSLIALMLKKMGVGILGIPVLVLGILAALRVFVRALIILPSIAVEKRLGIQESIILSKGMTCKIIFTPIIAAVKPILLMIAYLIVAKIAIFFVIHAFQPDKNALDQHQLGLSIFAYMLLDNNTLKHDLWFSTFVYILFCPITLYLLPWITVLSTTSLSNYYLWATQNAAQGKAATSSDTLPPV